MNGIQPSANVKDAGKFYEVQRDGRLRPVVPATYAIDEHDAEHFILTGNGSAYVVNKNLIARHYDHNQLLEVYGELPW